MTGTKNVRSPLVEREPARPEERERKILIDRATRQVVEAYREALKRLERA